MVVHGVVGELHSLAHDRDVAPGEEATTKVFSSFLLDIPTSVKVSPVVKVWFKLPHNFLKMPLVTFSPKVNKNSFVYRAFFIKLFL